MRLNDRCEEWSVLIIGSQVPSQVRYSLILRRKMEIAVYSSSRRNFEESSLNGHLTRRGVGFRHAKEISGKCLRT